MQLRIFTLVTLALTLNACIDEGVIGNQTSSVGGRGNTTTSTGGSTSTATGGTNNAGTAGQSPAPTLFTATLSSCGIKTIEAPTTQTLTVPKSPTTADPQAMWQPLLTACTDGGWDLARCAGSDILVTSATTDQTQTGNALPVTVNVMTKGSEVCCVTRTIAAPGGPMAAKCGPSTIANTALTACAIPTVAQSGVIELDIPADLTGPNWAVKSQTCTEGGWNLSLCAGSTATFSSFSTGTVSAAGNPLTTWVVVQGGIVCCLYASEANSNPGISPISCPM
jgi:hypothetical protein